MLDIPRTEESRGGGRVGRLSHDRKANNNHKVQDHLHHGALLSLPEDVEARLVADTIEHNISNPPRSPRRSFDSDRMTVEFHYLPCAKLAASAQFHMAINRDTAFCDHRLCRTAAIAQPRHFQQIIELDKFPALQLKVVHVLRRLY